MSLHNILLVARREFAQVMALKSFWLTLLLIPLALAIGPILGDKLDDNEPTRVVVIDRSGGSAGAALKARFGFEEGQRTLSALSRYVRRHKLERADPSAPWAEHDRWYTPTDVVAFRKAGGLDAALARIARVKPEGVPEFEPDEPAYAFAAPSLVLASADGEALEREANRLVQASKKAPKA